MSDRLTGHALRFISGKYQGGEFPLRPSAELIIGRSSDLDMVLVEDMVSRKHAKISTDNDQIVIQDLGSTNGTFVNGEKVKRVRLREGDRILIGTSIIKLVTTDGETAAAAVPGEFPSTAAPPPPTSPKRTVSGARSMAGTIDEIPLPDLMQLLSTSKKSGVLEVQTEEKFGRIYMRKGQVYYASINDSFDISPFKAVLRILTWESGTFELQPPDDKEFMDELKESTEGLLMEAMRQLDEIRRIEDELPPRDSQLQIVKPLETPLRELKPEQLDLLQTVLNHESTQAVIDHHAKSDLETYEAILELIKANVLIAS
ncbi:MAG: DUF4388 domain-containing protein [Deltaproteobacteria bacterium]|nr:DUF4388 domain-containing protein [Deltaproteobacteria bacterium]